MTERLAIGDLIDRSCKRTFYTGRKTSAYNALFLILTSLNYSLRTESECWTAYNGPSRSPTCACRYVSFDTCILLLI